MPVALRRLHRAPLSFNSFIMRTRWLRWQTMSTTQLRGSVMPLLDGCVGAKISINFGGVFRSYTLRKMQN